jgi:DNA gyrase subunit A
VREIGGDQYIFFATANGTVKRMSIEELKNIRNIGIRALTLDEGDQLISVSLTDGNQNILMATANGMAICYKETDVRAMGRTAMGVRGIKLREGDRVIGAGCALEGETVLSVTENGYGKRTPVEEYLRGGEVQGRGGYGMKNYTVTDKTGAVVDMKIVHGDEDLLMVSDDGTIIRTDVGTVSIYGRATQGVRLMRVAQDSRVISIACTEKEDDEEETDTASAPETQSAQDTSVQTESDE